MTEDERALLALVEQGGPRAYPVQKFKGGSWAWGPWRSIAGPPTVWKTKREAVASFEGFLGVLRDAAAGRI